VAVSDQPEWHTDLYIVHVDSHEGRRCEVVTAGDFATPVVAGDRVYAANTDGNIHVLEAGTCEWETPILIGGELKTRPVVADGLVIQVIGTGFVTREVGTWNEGSAWPAPGSEEFANATFNTAPAVAGGVVYIGGSNGSVYAIDLADGEKIWEWDEGGAAITSTPTVTDGVVYVATRDGEVVAIGGEPGVSSPTPACLRPHGEVEGTSKSGGDRLE
jgi:outer membrane protein assembly factor BamB